MGNYSAFHREIVLYAIIFSCLFGASILFVSISSLNVYGLEVFSKNDIPFGTSFDGWMGKWWNWWVATPTDEATPKDGGCLINTSGSMVMLMDTGVQGKPHQVCKISSNSGIMIPLWTGWCDETEKDHQNDTYEQLTKCAREQVNLGAVTSLVKVDGIPVAVLNEVSSIRSGSLDYKINSLNNVTEIYSKGFNITIPENTHFPDQLFGTFRAGAHGWFVFLKPLPPGDHTIFYNVGVTGQDVDNHSAEITYTLHVE